MNKSRLFLLSGLLVAMLFLASGTRSAMAIPPFQEGFYATYLKDAEKKPETKAFAEAVKAAKCNLCHQGRLKKDKNVYGLELSKLLDKRDDKDNAKKIAEALAKVAKIKCEPKKKDSKTFGELIAAGKLPGGEVKEGAEKP